MPNSYEINVAVWDKLQIKLFSSLINNACLNMKPPIDLETVPYRASGNIGVMYGFSEWNNK